MSEAPVAVSEMTWQRACSWFELMRFHWLCQKTTWISIHLVSTVHIPLTVSEDDLNQHTLGWDWWDSTDCVSEDDLGINTSLFWTSLIRLCVWRRLLSTHPWFEQNEILSTGLPLRDGLISSCLSLSALPVCGTSSLPTFVSTACVWYSHHFLPLSAKPVCGTPITSCLCQHCLCVVLPSLPAFLCQARLRPTDQGDILVCSPTHALSMSVILFIHKRF